MINSAMKSRKQSVPVIIMPFYLLLQICHTKLLQKLMASNRPFNYVQGLGDLEVCRAQQTYIASVTTPRAPSEKILRLGHMTSAGCRHLAYVSGG